MAVIMPDNANGIEAIFMLGRLLPALKGEQKLCNGKSRITNEGKKRDQDVSRDSAVVTLF